MLLSCVCIVACTCTEIICQYGTVVDRSIQWLLGDAGTSRAHLGKNDVRMEVAGMVPAG